MMKIKKLMLAMSIALVVCIPGFAAEPKAANYEALLDAEINMIYALTVKNPKKDPVTAFKKLAQVQTYFDGMFKDPRWKQWIDNAQNSNMGWDMSYIDEYMLADLTSRILVAEGLWNNYQTERDARDPKTQAQAKQTKLDSQLTFDNLLKRVAYYQDEKSTGSSAALAKFTKSNRDVQLIQARAHLGMALLMEQDGQWDKSLAHLKQARLAAQQGKDTKLEGQIAIQTLKAKEAQEAQSASAQNSPNVMAQPTETQPNVPKTTEGNKSETAPNDTQPTTTQPETPAEQPASQADKQDNTTSQE